MSKIAEILEKLIDLNSIVMRFENSETEFEIISSDLEVFYQFSVLRIPDIEKAISESLVNNPLNKHHVILIKIKEKLIRFIEFQKKTNKILEKINLKNLIDDKLSSISFQSKKLEDKLSPINKQLYDLKNAISASAYRDPQSITDELIEKQSYLKNKAEPIRIQYIELQKQKREQALLEYQKYINIDFMKIVNIFKTAITLCKVESDIPKRKTKQKYVEFSIVLQLHEAFDSLFFKNIAPEDLFQLLNLSEENIFYKIPKNCDTKFYYLIRILNKYVQKNSDDDWKDSIFKKLEINKETYSRNSLKAAKSESLKDKEFVKKVNKIFNLN